VSGGLLGGESGRAEEGAGRHWGEEGPSGTRLTQRPVSFETASGHGEAASPRWGSGAHFSYSASAAQLATRVVRLSLRHPRRGLLPAADSEWLLPAATGSLVVGWACCPTPTWARARCG